MFKTIIKAAENFCVHQIRLPHEVNDGDTNKRMFIAYIDLNASNGEKHRVYLASDLNFTQRISKVFLEEEESDEETLTDMLLETANMIVGSAKVIAEEANENPYIIETPHYVKLDVFDFEYDQAKVVKIEGDEMIIAIKELDV